MNIKPGSAYNKLKVKFAQGGQIPGDDKPKSKTYTNKAEYDKALQAYNDTLASNQITQDKLDVFEMLGWQKDSITTTTQEEYRRRNPIGDLSEFNYKGIDALVGLRTSKEKGREHVTQAFPVYKKPVVKPEYQSLSTPIMNEGERQMEARYKPTTTLAKGTLEQEVKPTMAKGTMESEIKPTNELMMPSGSYMQKDDFIKRYGEKPWLKATGQKFAFGGKMKYDVGGSIKPMNKDGTYGVQEQPQDNTNWANMVGMAGNMVQGTQNYSQSPNAGMYKTEDAVFDTVGQLGPVGAVVGGVTDVMNTALRPVRETNDAKAGTSGYSEGLTIAGGLLNPLAALQTRGKYEGGYTDITGEGYEKYMAGLNRRAKFRENIGDFDANMNANINQISYLNSSPTFAKGGKIYANGGQMTTEYKTGGTHEQNPNGGIPIGNSLMEEGEIRFDYLENKQPKSYIFSNRIKYKK